ncbi:hypothetical protein CEQ90_10125 [Lewinellaceae bacterium SD302]|nr:hypothetical protein CEQ90_10125 [Lewinellaceae bacterium SD302]
MKKLIKRLAPVLLAFIFPLLLFAQPKFKYGKVSADDLAMTELASDTSAAACILYHKSTVFFENQGQPTLVQDVEKRIKLFKRSAFEEADLTFYFSDEYETITEVNAAIHLPDGEEIKLKKRDFIYADHTDGLRTLRFTFPRVEEGAILEYRYRRRDQGLATLPKFYFQEKHPVRWAEYEADIPEYYNYVSLTGANHNWAINSDETLNRTNTEGDNINVRRLHYATENQPAFVEETYGNNQLDYLPQTHFQLVSVTYPNVRERYYITSWFSLAKSLEDDLNFGRKFNNRADIKLPCETIEKLLKPGMSETEKATVAYREIGNHMNWNEVYRIMTDDRLNTCWQKSSGSSAEINMILLGVLKELDIKASPILVSLRNEGMHIQTYPIFDQFDHLMVLAELDGKEVIMDVNDPYRAPGLPRFDALNEFGWVADADAPRWISISPPKANRTVMSTISLQEDGMAKVHLRARLQGYFAQEGQGMLQEVEESNGPLFSRIMESFPEAELENRTISETEELYDPLEMELDVILPLGMANGEYMYVMPIVLPGIDETLTDAEERTMPIDLGYRWKDRYIATLKPPTGYAVEELPESQVVSSEDGKVNIKYTAAAANGEIRIIYTIDMDKAVFPAKEYVSIKALYEKALEFQETPIVLRRAKK